MFQDSEEIKSNSLDTQLKAKEELLLTLKLHNASEQEVDFNDSLLGNCILPKDRPFFFSGFSHRLGSPELF